MLKRMIIIVTMLLTIPQITVCADEYITRENFIINACRLLKSDGAGDVSSAVSTACELGIVEESFSEKGKYITEEEALVILAKIFLVRCGESDALGMSTFINNYLEIDSENRRFFNVAATINAVNYHENLRVRLKTSFEEENAQTLIENTKKAIDNFIEIMDLKTTVNVTKDFYYINRFKKDDKISVTVSLNDLTSLNSENPCLT